MSLSLRAMAYVTTALRRRSIAAAAAELNVAPSAVAAALDQAEAAFGLTLAVRRRARGIAPTASGRIVAARCERLLEEHRALMAEGAGLREALSGSLRIGYYAPVAPAFLPRLLRDFVPEPGAVSLHLEDRDNEGAQAGLLSGAYDAILFVAEGARAGVAFDPLVTAPPYCLMPVGHPLAALDAVPLARIAEAPQVVLDRPVAAAYYAGLFAAQGRSPVVAAQSNATEMVRSLVGAGHGLAILNMRPRSDVSYGGDGLVARPIADPLPPLTLAVGYDKARPRRLVARFAEACRAHFAAVEPGDCVVG